MDKLSNEKINKIVDIVLKQCNIFGTNLPRSTSARNALLNYTKTYNEYEGVEDYRTISPIFRQTKTIFNKSITNAYNKGLGYW
ncbi:15020_t:CDS:1, partial [Gigaspora margarita]